MKLRINASQMSKMDTCGFAYNAYYRNNLESAVKSVSLAFGDAVHKACTDWIINRAVGQEAKEPIRSMFERYFTEHTKNSTLSYPDKWTERDFRECGLVMVERFTTWWIDSGYMPLMGPQGPWVEKMLTAKLGGPGILPNFPSVQIELYGTPDIIAMDLQGRIFDLDLKTTAAEYDPIYISNSGQLTMYDILMDANKAALGIDRIDGRAFLQLVRRKVSTKGGKGPTLEAPPPSPPATPEQIEEFKQKILWTAEDILRERFPRKSHSAFNTPCSLCDVSLLCTKGDMTGLTLRKAA